MHMEAINHEADFEVEKDAVKSIATNDKRASSKDDSVTINPTTEVAY
jgi:hypothetical protein